MSRYAPPLFIAIFALVFLLTCSEDSPTESDDGNNDGLTVTPSSTDSPSGSWVSLTGLPAGDSTYYGIVTSTAKASDTGYAAVVVADSGHYLIVPLNPTDPVGGGELQVIITNNSKSAAAPFTLTLDSLPPAPGEFAAVVALMQDAFTASLAAVGWTRDSLDYQNPQDVPITRLPYVIAYAAIDSPDNPNSLRAIADHTAPYLSTFNIDYDLIDRLMAQMDLRAYYEELGASLDKVRPVFYNNAQTDWRPKAQRSSLACIPAPDYGITTCGALANAMQQQYALEVAAGSAAEKLKNDGIAGTLAAVSLIPGAAPLTATLGGGVWVQGLIDAGFKDMLPSEFVDGATSFDPSETQFKEDFISPGSWSQFLVTATSNGWRLDKVALQAIMQVLGARGAGESLTKVPGAFEEEIGGALEGMFIDMGTGNVIDKFADGSDIIEVCPNTWSNIDCVGLDYSTLTSNTNRLDIDSAAQTYEPKDVGPDVMRIETKNMFGQDNNTGTAVAVNTDKIQVFIDPFQAEADTSEELMFSARVENAENTEVTWSLEGGGTFFPDNNLVTVFTPGQEWNPPMMLKARSQANTGLREGKVDSDPRDDDAEIRYDGGGEAIITPASICLKPNEPHDFTVNYTGPSIDSVRWEIDPPGTGSITGSGPTITYTAPPQQAGQITLSATVNGKATGYAYVDISSCICTWIFEGAGAGSSWFGTGNWATASTVGGTIALNVNLRQDSLDGFNPPFAELWTYDFIGAGTYDADAMLFVVSDTVDWSNADPDVPLPTLEITAYEENDYVQGRVYGTLSRLVEDEHGVDSYLYITFSMTFRAEFPNSNRPQCIDD